MDAIELKATLDFNQKELQTNNDKYKLNNNELTKLEN